MGRLIRVLSLGAGVQSSTIALMAAHGEIEPIDAAIFADTLWEPREVYTWLICLEGFIFKQLNPFPVYRVCHGDLKLNILEKHKESGSRFAAIPFFTETGGRGKRQCTGDFKIQPIGKEIRRLCGIGEPDPTPKKPDKKRGWKKSEYAEVIKGISWDEIERMNESKYRWERFAYPLIDLRMTRGDCLEWMKSHGYPEPPKSACLGCPFHDDAAWARLKKESPEEFAEVVEVDHAIRAAGPVRGMSQLEYMHRSLQPIDEIDFERWRMERKEKAGQTTINDFINECEGVCGV